MLKKIKNILLFWGIDPRVSIYNLINFPQFLKDYFMFRSLARGKSGIRLGKLYPALSDKKKSGGALTDHYFYQDLLVAQMIFKNNPEKHIDIGSRIDGFVAHVASFREIEVFDIRHTDYLIPNVKFITADFMNVHEAMFNYTDSASSLHAIEHFGLGRYGDPLDPDGHIKGINAISRVIRKGGKFYFSVPIGNSRVEFNAHRVFSVSYLLKILERDFNINTFSYIDDHKILHQNVKLLKDSIDNDFQCCFGCGIFELTKR